MLKHQSLKSVPRFYWMKTIRQLAKAEFRGLPLLLVTYGALMVHFIYGRAFRDSLLGSHLRIQLLPFLTLWGTLLSVIASLTVSALLRSEHRARTAGTIYAINALIEFLFALSSRHFPSLYSLFFVEMSASTIIGLSIIWILIGDWASSCEADRKRLIPAVLLYGTTVSILAGVGLTHLRIAAGFQSANVILATMNTISVVALLFYRNGLCFVRPNLVIKRLPQRPHPNHKLLRKFAVLTVAAAATSTLLDLMFRIRVVEHFPHQVDRLHFLGLFQSLLSVSAFLSQMALGRVMQKKVALVFFHLHPAAICIASCLLAFAPGFWPFAFLRNGEYSMRNSLFRFGSEMAYGLFPDHERAVVRPLIDVIGERLGDLCASGMLAFLLFVNPQLPTKLGLFLLALCSLVFWRICRSLERSMSAFGMSATRDLTANERSKLPAMAHEGAGIN
jgi:ATP/ADP translocase